MATQETPQLTTELTPEETEQFTSSMPEWNLEEALIQFDTPEEIIQFVDGMTYFDENLHLKQELLASMSPVTSSDELFKFVTESSVVGRLLTIHKWNDLPTEGKAFFKRMITAPSPAYPDETSRLLKLTKLGAHMTSADWDVYEKAFTTLYELHA